jgi:hypothetical protein
MQVITGYLLLLGGISAIGLLLALLLVIAYLLQLLLQSVAEVVHLFLALPPLAQLLIALLIIVLGLWIVSHKMRVKIYGIN